MEDLKLTITQLVKEKLYVNPEVKIKNLRTHQIKILDKDDSQVKNDYIFRDEWELEPLRDEVIEPLEELDDLPF